MDISDIYIITWYHLPLPVVVSLHLQVEDLALGVAGLGDEILVEEGEDVAADLPQLLLDLLAVLLGHLLLPLGALSLLLDRRDHPPRAPARADHVLVRHRQQIPAME